MFTNSLSSRITLKEKTEMVKRSAERRRQVVRERREKERDKQRKNGFASYVYLFSPCGLVAADGCYYTNELTMSEASVNLLSRHGANDLTRSREKFRENGVEAAFKGWALTEERDGRKPYPNPFDKEDRGNGREWCAHHVHRQSFIWSPEFTFRHCQRLVTSLKREREGLDLVCRFRLLLGISVRCCNNTTRVCSNTGIVQRTNLCRSELPANDSIRILYPSFFSPAFLFNANATLSVANFTTAKFHA
ncbi:hypothetical protein EVAR_9141_1 [Eumeta japonica]|uniref:Uncharacterized protein n=1 Tax=Eumeta variegata TaxID=151549 RepID=A0A4C1TWA7_EUMVA|nr:hypothetical protein EVAR_9141_1 [Eumeta japonica]